MDSLDNTAADFATVYYATINITLYYYNLPLLCSIYLVTVYRHVYRQ